MKIEPPKLDAFLTAIYNISRDDQQFLLNCDQFMPEIVGLIIISFESKQKYSTNNKYASSERRDTPTKMKTTK